MATNRTQGVEGMDPFAGILSDVPIEGVRALGGDPPTPSGQASTTARASGTVEITLIGDFVNPWTADPALEARLSMGQIANAHWSPGTDTMEAVAHAETSGGGAGAIRKCSSLDEMLSLITTAGGLISRVNVITHGDSGGVGMIGEIKATAHHDPKNDPDASWVVGDVFFTGSPPLIDVGALTSPDPTMISKRDAARARMGSQARVVLYACSTGVTDAFARKLAGFLAVSVSACTRNIGYFPTISNKVISNRTKTGVLGADGKPDPAGVTASGFKHMDASFYTVP